MSQRRRRRAANRRFRQRLKADGFGTASWRALRDEADTDHDRIVTDAEYSAWKKSANAAREKDYRAGTGSARGRRRRGRGQQLT